MKKFVWVMVLLLAACGEEPLEAPGPVIRPPDPPAPMPTLIEQAEAEFPRFLELQSKVISRTCSPNPGVCHGGENRPDLRSAANTLALIGAPCNVEMPDPTQGWDACEPVPDVLIAQEYSGNIAWAERIDEGVWRLTLDTPAPADARVIALIADQHNNIVLDPFADQARGAFLIASLQAGSVTASISIEHDDPRYINYYRNYYDPLIALIAQGDHNRNGVFGAGTAAIISPGDRQASYLWRRITGTAPGTRMPLANQPLSPVEYLAIGCWLETTSSTSTALDTINYKSCNYATTFDPNNIE